MRQTRAGILLMTAGDRDILEIKTKIKLRACESMA